MNKGKHDNYELNDIEDAMLFSPASGDDEIEEQMASVTAQAVAVIVKERLTKVQDPRKERSHLRIFGTVVIITVVKLNSKNTRG